MSVHGVTNLRQRSIRGYKIVVGHVINQMPWYHHNRDRCFHTAIQMSVADSRIQRPQVTLTFAHVRKTLENPIELGQRVTF